MTWGLGTFALNHAPLLHPLNWRHTQALPYTHVDDLPTALNFSSLTEEIHPQIICRWAQVWSGAIIWGFWNKICLGPGLQEPLSINPSNLFSFTVVNIKGNPGVGEHGLFNRRMPTESTGEPLHMVSSGPLCLFPLHIPVWLLLQT